MRGDRLHVLKAHLAGADEPDTQLRRSPCPAVRVRHEPSVPSRVTGAGDRPDRAASTGTQPPIMPYAIRAGRRPARRLRHVRSMRCAAPGSVVQPRDEAVDGGRGLRRSSARMPAAAGRTDPRCCRAGSRSRRRASARTAAAAAGVRAGRPRGARMSSCDASITTTTSARASIAAVSRQRAVRRQIDLVGARRGNRVRRRGGRLRTARSRPTGRSRRRRPARAAGAPRSARRTGCGRCCPCRRRPA